MSLNNPQNTGSLGTGSLGTGSMGDPAGSAASDTAESALRATRRGANQTLDNLESNVESARDTIQPAIARLASQAESLARRGLDVMRDSAGQVRERAQTMGDVTVRYVKDEPVKAVLIAAAAGAALMALASLIQSSRRNNP